MARRPSRLAAQSAMEYLMTYGWAILIIAVVLAALFELGVFNGSNLAPQACIAQAGFVCKNPVYTANGIGITFGQTTGMEYFDSFMFIAAEGEPLNSMGIPQNFTDPSNGLFIGNLLPGQTVGADFNSSKFAHGQIPANAPIGTPFAGYVWLGYCLSPCSAPTAYSKVATITAKEAGTSSASFGGYFGGGSGSSSPPPAPPPSQQTYSVTLADNPSGYGTASSPNSLTGISPGNTISITASPKNGYIFTGWSSSTGNIVIADPSVESTTANVEGSGTVTAGFAIPYVPISLSTSGTTPAPFQQNLSVGGYSTFTYNGVTYNGINQQWSNVEFTTGPAGTGTALQAWCESGCSGSSTAIVWVRLPNGFSGSTTIYMNFMPNDVMSASGPTGEAAQISAVYGEYDNIGSVMNSGLLYQIWGWGGSGIQPQSELYQAIMSPDSSFTFGSTTATASSTMYTTPSPGTTQDVDGNNQNNVIINYQNGYSGGSPPPNPPVSNYNYWLVKAIGFVDYTSGTQLYGIADDAIGLGYSGVAQSFVSWLGGTDNPNNIISEWIPEGATVYSNTIPSSGDYAIELDFENQGGPGYIGMWSNNPLDYYSPSYPPNGQMPHATFGAVQ